jgi:allantoicase
VRLWRLSLQQELEGAIDSRFGDRVNVVQDEHKGCRSAGQVVDQGRQQRFDGWQARRTQQVLHVLADRRIELLERGKEIGEKTGGIVVTLVQ